MIMIRKKFYLFVFGCCSFSLQGNLLEDRLGRESKHHFVRHASAILLLLTMGGIFQHCSIDKPNLDKLSMHLSLVSGCRAFVDHK